MPPEAYNELVKARPANGKPAFALLEGLPSPVIMEVQSIAAPENVSAQIPAAKQALVQNQSANIFSRLLQYLSKQIEQVQGSQNWIILPNKTAHFKQTVGYSRPFRLQSPQRSSEK